MCLDVYRAMLLSPPLAVESAFRTDLSVPMVRAFPEKANVNTTDPHPPTHPTRLPHFSRAPRETVRDIQASFKFQAGMGANMILAVFTMFIISYWASKFIVGDNKAHVSDWKREEGEGERKPKEGV